MHKLLTEEEKKAVAALYAERRAVVMLGSLILVLTTFLAGLMPSFIISSARKNEVLERTRIIESTGLKGDEAELQAWLNLVKQELQLMSPKFDTDKPTLFIQEVVNKRSSGVTLTNFTWTKSKNKVALSISGVAADRQALISFENSIKASPSFSGVSLPISDFAQNKNIDFQIKFALASTSMKETP